MATRQELKNNSVALQLYENVSDEARDEAHDKNGGQQAGLQVST